MRVRMLTGLAGEGRQPGDVLDLPPNEARALVEAQRAELVTAPVMETPEGGAAQRTRKRAGKAVETRGRS